MACTIIKSKNREEWLKNRAMGIGSSEVGTILGVNPWDTPLALWRRKKGIDAPKVENFAMKAGHYLEDAVSLFYADATGKEIIKSSAGDWIMRDNDKPYLQVSPDRTFWIPGRTKNDRNKGILECKTTQMDVDKDNLPKYWFCQLQYQLGVAGYEQGALAWLRSGREFDYQDITFDADFYAWMVEEIDKFWIDNILGNVEPAPVSVADVMLKYPKSYPGEAIEANGEAMAAMFKLRAIKDEMSKLDASKKECEDIIKTYMGGAEILIDQAGSTMATWKTAKDSTKFDDKAFKAANPGMYEEYMKITPGSRRFLIK